MKQNLLGFLALVLILALTGIRPLLAEEASTTKAESEDINFKYKTVTTKEGLVFRVPEDMPLETRNGIMAPIPFDEYMYSKFKQVDTKLKDVNDKLDRIEKKIDSLQPEKPKVLSAH